MAKAKRSDGWNIVWPASTILLNFRCVALLCAYIAMVQFSY